MGFVPDRQESHFVPDSQPTSRFVPDKPIESPFAKAGRFVADIPSRIHSATSGAVLGAKEALDVNLSPASAVRGAFEGAVEGWKTKASPWEASWRATQGLPDIPNIPPIPTPSGYIPEPHTAVLRAAGVNVPSPRLKIPQYDIGQIRQAPRAVTAGSVYALTDPLTPVFGVAGKILKTRAVAGALSRAGNKAFAVVRKIPVANWFVPEPMPKLSAAAREAVLDAERMRAAREFIGKADVEAAQGAFAEGLSAGERARVGLLSGRGSLVYDVKRGERPLAGLVAAEGGEVPKVSVETDPLKRELLERGKAAREILSRTAMESERMGMLKPGTVKPYETSIPERIDRLLKKFKDKAGRDPTPDEFMKLAGQAESDVKNFVDPNVGLFSEPYGGYTPRKYKMFEVGFTPEDLEKNVEATRKAISNLTVPGKNKRRLLLSLERHLPDIRQAVAKAQGGDPEQFFSSMKPARAKLKIFSKRQEIPEVVRKNLFGEISGAADTIPVKVGEMRAAQNARKFADQLASDPLLAEDVIDSAARAKGGAKYAGYVQVPETTVGGGRTWGNLAGKWVSPEISKRIEFAGNPQSFWDTAAKTAQILVQGSKSQHVLASPKTNVGNFAGNIIMDHMTGFPIWEQVKMAPRVFEEFERHKKGLPSPYFEEAVKSGTLIDTLVGSEMRGPNLEKMRTGSRGVLERLQKFLAPKFRVPLPDVEVRKAMVETAPGIRAPTGRTLAKVGTAKQVDLAKFYASIENRSRLARFMWERIKNGKTPDEARKAVDFALLNYRHVSPAVKFMRNSILGGNYLTFFTKSLEQQAQLALKDPMRAYELYKIKDAIEQDAIYQHKLRDIDVKAIREQNWGPEIITRAGTKMTPKVLSISSLVPGWLGEKNAAGLLTGPLKALYEAYFKKNLTTGQDMGMPDVFESTRRKQAQTLYSAMASPMAPPIPNPVDIIGKPIAESGSARLRDIVLQMMRNREEGKSGPRMLLRGGSGTTRIMDALARRRAQPGTTPQDAGDAIGDALAGAGLRPADRGLAIMRLLADYESKQGSAARSLVKRLSTKDPRFTPAEREAARATLRDLLRKQARELLAK